MVADAVLLPVGVVCVAGAKGVDEVAVITAALIFVPNQEGDGRPGRLPLENPGEDLNGVGFLALRHMA